MRRTGTAADRVSGGGLALFASGDFACNLFWQSVTLFLMFYYTDILALPPATAGAILMVGALWHGMADITVGAVAQHRGASYRRFLIVGAVPLGLAFVLVFWPWRGAFAASGALAAQIAFRTLYAAVNVPYAAWSTRISDDSRDRSVVAGLRMLFGTAAAATIALGLPWIANGWGYATAAAVLAAVAIPLLMLVGATSPEAAPSTTPPAPLPLLTCLVELAGNRAFVTLNVASAAAGIAAALLNQSVLYYFVHVLRDARGGPATLAMMGVAGALFVPLWMAASVRWGARVAWLGAAGGGMTCLTLFATTDAARMGTQIFCLGMQGAFVGLNLCFWAMLPDTVDYGEDRSGVRVEAVAFGVAALVQKLALAAAAATIGLAYAAIGYRPDAPVASAATGIRSLMLWAPSAGLALSIAAMSANPLRRGVHERIMARLRG